MRIAEFLQPSAVLPGLTATTKPEVLRELAAGLSTVVPQIGAQRFLAVLEERERQQSTGMEKGVAIPHARLAELSNLVACFAVSRQGVAFEALDGRPSHYFFALVAPAGSPGLHLKALSKINRIFRSEALKESILQCNTADEICALIVQEDARS